MKKRKSNKQLHNLSVNQCDWTPVSNKAIGLDHSRQSGMELWKWKQIKNIYDNYHGFLARGRKQEGILNNEPRGVEDWKLTCASQ
jgi:hypothetical protein